MYMLSTVFTRSGCDGWSVYGRIEEGHGQQLYGQNLLLQNVSGQV